MKKMIIVLVAVLMTLTVGCIDNTWGTSKPTNNPTTDVPPATDKVIERTTNPEVTMQPTEETTAPTMQPEETENPEEYDFFGVLEVSEDFARKNGGAYLKRDGKLYSLTKIPLDRAKKTGVGQRSAWNYNLGALLVQGKSNCFFTAGEVPIFFYSDGDEFISYADSTIFFRPTVFRGYTLRVSEGAVAKFVYNDIESDPAEIRYDMRTDFQILDSKGQPVEDFRNINFGEECTVSWFEGTTYHEHLMVANCEYYYAGPLEGSSSVDGTRLEGKLNKEGYATYDLSILEPGSYLFGASGHYGIIMIG